MIKAQKNPIYNNVAVALSWLGAAAVAVFGVMCLMAVVIEAFPSILEML